MNCPKSFRQGIWAKMVPEEFNRAYHFNSNLSDFGGLQYAASIAGLVQVVVDMVRKGASCGQQRIRHCSNQLSVSLLPGWICAFFCVDGGDLGHYIARHRGDLPHCSTMGLCLLTPVWSRNEIVFFCPN